MRLGWGCVFLYLDLEFLPLFTCHGSGLGIYIRGGCIIILCMDSFILLST